MSVWITPVEASVLLRAGILHGNTAGPAWGSEPTVSNSDRPSQPSPLTTPIEGYLRPGLIYVDDSETALRAMRRALYPRGLLLETFNSLAALRARGDLPIVGALLDVDLDGESGLDVARAIRAMHPHAAIAFFTADTSDERSHVLVEFGEVFLKDRDQARALEWLVSLATLRTHAHDETG